MVAANRTMNQGTDQLPIDARALDRALAALNALFARQCVNRPEPPLANAAHQLQSSLRQPEPLVERRQAVFDLGGRDDLLRQGVAKGLQTNVLIANHGSRSSAQVQMAKEETNINIPLYRRAVNPHVGAQKRAEPFAD